LSIGENALGVNNNLFEQMNVEHPTSNVESKEEDKPKISPLPTGVRD
jgi:hypothetical protein